MLRIIKPKETFAPVSPLATEFAEWELARGTRRLAPCFAGPLATRAWHDVAFSLQACRLWASRTRSTLAATGPQPPPGGGSGFIGIMCDSARTRYCPARIAAPPSFLFPPCGKRGTGGTGSGQSTRCSFPGSPGITSNCPVRAFCSWNHPCNPGTRNMGEDLEALEERVTRMAATLSSEEFVRLPTDPETPRRTPKITGSGARMIIQPSSTLTL